MLPCSHASMLPCFHASMLPCLHAPMLSCFHVSMLPLPPQVHSAQAFKVVFKGGIRSCQGRLGQCESGSMHTTPSLFASMHRTQQPCWAITCGRQQAGCLGRKTERTRSATCNAENRRAQPEAGQQGGCCCCAGCLTCAANRRATRKIPAQFSESCTNSQDESPVPRHGARDSGPGSWAD